MGVGAPIGNTNVKKAMLWKSAIMRALAKHGDGGRLEALDSLAEQLIALCAKGDLAALKEFGDRIDGKPAQAVELSTPDGPVMLQAVDWNIVPPANTSG